MGAAKIDDLSVAGEMRVAGIPFERRDHGGVGIESEFRGTGPGEGAVIKEFGIDEAK